MRVRMVQLLAVGNGGRANGVFPRHPFTSPARYDHLNQNMRSGDPVRLNVGCEQDHYQGDLGWTVPVSGRYDDGQRETWNIFVAADHAVVLGLRDGATVNPVNGLTTNSAANASERAPFLGLAPLVARLESSGSSTYNSQPATANKRMSHGLQFLAAYTFSKSIDTAGDSHGSAALGFFGAPIIGEQVFNDQNNVAAQRGLSDFDRRHRFVVSYTWELPQPANHHRFAFSKLVEGWAISGVVTLQSGLPFSILDRAAGTLFGPAT